MGGKTSKNEPDEPEDHKPEQKKQKLDDNAKEKQNDFSTLPCFLQNNEEREQNGFQYLCTPLKSKDDIKEYRTLKLQNGLTALLISDNNQHSSKEAIKSLQPLDCSKNVEIPLSDEKSKDKVDCEYQAICSLCVNVGSSSDPPHAQGLAHLLEHTISMGSKKYPKENDYSAFIEQRWGICNAVTDHEYTLYSFQIREKYLSEALDRFANVFIDPLLTKDSISRECHAIENEFKLNQQSDDIRKHQLIYSFGKSDHQIFPCGNNITLQRNINLDKLHLELHKFREQHYSAHRMTLAIQASLSLDVLEDLAKQCFTHIPVNHLPQNNCPEYTGIDCFDSSKFRRIYYVKTMKDVLELELNWVLPPMSHLYKSKPWFYILRFLLRTEEGSLFHYLNKKEWAIHKDSDDAIAHTSTYCLFSLRLSLTNEGYNRLDQVLKIIFSYINFVQRECTDQLIFDQFQQYITKSSSFSTNFEYPTVDDLEYLVLNMQYYPPAYYLNGYDFVFEYDPKTVQYFINFLKPENVNIIISSKKLDNGGTRYRELVYQTEYSSKEISQEWIESWKNAKILPEFYFKLKDERQVLVKNLSISQSENITAELSQISNDKNISLWYKKNPSYDSFEFSMCIYLNHPSLHESTTQSVVNNIILRVFNETYSSLNLVLCQLSLKGFLITISTTTTKIHPLGQIAQLLLDFVFCDKFITEEIFNSTKSKMLRQLYNLFIDPIRLSSEAWVSLTVSKCYMAHERYNALVDMTYDQFTDYLRNKPRKFFVQCLFEGNLKDEEIFQRVFQIIEPVLIDSPSLNKNDTPQILKFMNGEKCCQIKNMNQSDAITIVNNFYQTDIVSVKLLVMCKLLTGIINEPLFHCLRTQEQLGYHVEFHHSYFQGVIVLDVVVFTQADKFTGEYINGRIQNFINNYAETLKNMPKEEFDLVKENYFKYDDKDVIPNVQLLDFKTETLGEPLHEICAKENESLKSLTLKELHSFYVNYMVGGSGYKKMSIQVVGTPDSSNIDDKVDNLKDGKYLLKYSTEIQEDEKMNSDYYISDINTYKSLMESY